MSPQTLRLLTFNLQNGTPTQGWSDLDIDGVKGRRSVYGWRGLVRGWAGLVGPKSVTQRAQNSYEALHETAQALRELHPDILCLQEVDKGQRRSGYLHQAAYFAEALGMPYWRAAASFSGPVYGWHRRPIHAHLNREGGYGIALLSKWPVKSWHFMRIGKARTRLKWAGAPWEGFAGGFLAGVRNLPAAFNGFGIVFGQLRVLQAARILTPLGVIAVGNTHLETSRNVAQSQLRRAWRAVHRLEEESCVVAGDFNISPANATEALQLLDSAQRPQTHGFIGSYPAENPRLYLDQLLATGWRLAASPRAVRLPISDHCAVIYDLRPEAL